MKTNRPTLNCTRWSQLLGLVITMFIASISSVQAQCPLACNDLIQVSVDLQCCITLTPDMLLEDPGTQCKYGIIIYDEDNNIVPGATVCNDHVGQTLKVKVTLGANSCWSYVSVEDKVAPRVDCASPQIEACNDTTYIIQEDDVIDNCGGYKTIIVSDTWEDYDCNERYSGARIICRAYQDSSGNVSDTCCHYIYFERPDPADIVFPEDTIIECHKFVSADPEITGYPTWNGHMLDHDGSYCEINLSYSDDTLHICPGSYKIIREWLVYFWCLPSIGNNPLLSYQVIKVLDEKAPEVYCPTTPQFRDTISTDIWTCTGSYLLPEPYLLFGNMTIQDSGAIYIFMDDECSIVSYTVRHQAATSPSDCRPSKNAGDSRLVTQLPNGRWTVDGLPAGCNWFYYTFKDQCGNVTECAFDIVVKDRVNPVAVCDQHTVVSVTIDGTGKLFATSVDDGSWDNCALYDMKVRRMDRGEPCGNNVQTFEDYVEFCCNDIGSTRMVEFAVWDECGNSNICMVEVVTQDKLAPSVTCPPHITISCKFEYDDLNEFGTIVNAKFKQTRNPIVIDDPNVRFGGPAIDGEYYDNCVASFTVDADTNVHCGAGTITRTFTVKDRQGLTSTCAQVITVVDYDPFYMSAKDWPRDYISASDCINGTDVDTSITGYPNISDRGCGDIYVGWDDQVFTIEPDACLKVLRHWTVIDWCYYDPNDPETEGVWTHTQVIKLTNTVAPAFTSSCAFREFELYGECTEAINLTASAEDDCTAQDKLRWKWELDLNNNGNIDMTGTGNDFIRVLGQGRHHIRWIVADQCGNESDCWYEFDVIDRKNPTPYCRNGLITVVMEVSKSITVWASDFNIGSFDNCTDTADLEYRFLVNGRFVKEMIFTCADLGEQEIIMYVIDEAGNYDACTTKIEIQDPNNLCGTTNIVRITGGIQSWFGDMVRNVDVRLSKTTNSQAWNNMTTAQGEFAFNQVAMYSNYLVAPTKLDKPENGVTTKDLVLIQRHLLGMQTFNNAFYYIAADANNNEEIAASDIAELRRLVLGEIDDFRFGQESWRFVENGFVFADPNDPFPYKDATEYFDLDKDKMATNFTAVKIGDLDGDATVNANGVVIRGDDGTLVLEADDARFSENETINIPVTMKNMTTLLGLQTTISFDAQAMEFVGIESGTMDVCDACINDKQASKGEVSMSWYEVTPKNLGEDVIFTLVFKGLEDNSLSSTLSLTSGLTPSEAFSDLEVSYSIELTFRDSESLKTAFELYQNVPNPFSSSTSIGFNLPESQNVELSMFDMTGKVLKVVNGHFEKGYHEFLINANDLSFEGVLYYQLTAGSHSSTRKMLLVR